MKQKQSILFLTKLYHPHIGGVEKHVETISNALVQKGYSILIVTEQHEKKLKLEEDQNGIEIKRIPVTENGSMKKFSIWKWMILNMNVLWQADIIHIHDVYYWYLPFFFIFPHKRVFITFHGYENYPIKKRWILGRKIAEIFANGTICVGDFMKKWYFASPTYVSYGGVRLESKNIVEKKNSAVFFGRLDSQTGIELYLEAYKILKSKNKNFTLTIYGDGPLRKIVPSDVKVYPFTKDIVPKIASHSVIFVSRYLSMLEALVLEKNIIAVFTDPIKEDYLKMSPFSRFVMVTDNKEEIVKFVNSKKKINKEGKNWAKTQTWEKVIKMYLSLWGFTKSNM